MSSPLSSSISRAAFPHMSSIVQRRYNLSCNRWRWRLSDVTKPCQAVARQPYVGAQLISKLRPPVAITPLLEQLADTVPPVLFDSMCHLPCSLMMPAAFVAHLA